MPIGFNHNTHSVNPSEDSVIEIGAIYGSARSSTPSGYLLRDGSNTVSRSSYSNLFNTIVKGDEQQKQEYVYKCLQIKAKYLKPIKEEI